MTLKYWGTFSILVLSILLEMLWILVAVDVGYLRENELFALLPLLAVIPFLPLIIAITLVKISSFLPIKMLKSYYFHRNINLTAFLIAFIIFIVMAMQKVPPSLTQTEKEEKNIPTTPLFQQMQKNCIKYHNYKDGFNTTQIQMHCTCITKYAKQELPLKEIKTITKLLSTKKTSESAFLTNTDIASIVIQCVAEIDAHSK